MIKVEKLDKMYGKFLETKVEPIDVDLLTGVTIFPEPKEDAFELKRPEVGSIKFVYNENQVVNSGCVVRCIIGYSQLDRLQKDKNFGYFYLGLFKNAMLKAACKYFNLQQAQLITFKRPGDKVTFFREVEECAGVELRLWVQKKNGEVNE